ncbi:hypothetical protein CXG81DRAFT_15167 [Caulochytrium protostelioides]|uniref:Phosphoesterase-domain-containing protein n=1 Tax=Caulochytrium protostelioides TaxID=1555241 RepID=A0A4P9WZU9_9FUNG|nr:hypothetical protein CXG81DRAFT_15167 [Caulochytrium protostelioides]|eukprot:RKO99001.1 hypothetical protein CXG81DRAFT_15167 [Caulochytrium protostelioides]
MPVSHPASAAAAGGTSTQSETAQEGKPPADVEEHPPLETAGGASTVPPYQGTRNTTYVRQKPPPYQFDRTKPDSWPIKNVVLIVLENRSFDHYLGAMADERPDINGVHENDTYANPTWDVYQTEDLDVLSKQAVQMGIRDPPHEANMARLGIYGKMFPEPDDPPNMSGFVKAAQLHWRSSQMTDLRDIMDGMDTKTMLPVTWTLANEFAVFQNWYASVPGPTYPNRLFIYSCTSRGDLSNFNSRIFRGYPQDSIFTRLTQQNVSWINYHTMAPLSLFFKDQRSARNIRENTAPYEDFAKHAANGELPEFTMIDPTFVNMVGAYVENDAHPPSDTARAEALVKEVYEAVRNGPQWNTTLLIITFDEHGGFWDHVPPPAKGVPPPDVYSSSRTDFAFDRLGLRVPTIMISPWINKGRVVSEPEPDDKPSPTSHFEHCSLAATFKKMFGWDRFLTRRDAWAATFEGIFLERSEPRTDCPTTLPEPLPFMDDGNRISGLKLGIIEAALRKVWTIMRYTVGVADLTN